MPSTLPPVGVLLVMNKPFDAIPNLWAPRIGKDSKRLMQMAEEMVTDALDIKPDRVRVTNELHSTPEIKINILPDGADEDPRSPMQLGVLLIQKIKNKEDAIHQKVIATHVIKAEFHEQPFPDTVRRGSHRDSWSGGICVFRAPGEKESDWKVAEDEWALDQLTPQALRSISEEFLSLSREVSGVTAVSHADEIQLQKQISACLSRTAQLLPTLSSEDSSSSSEGDEPTTSHPISWYEEASLQSGINAHLSRALSGKGKQQPEPSTIKLSQLSAEEEEPVLRQASGWKRLFAFRCLGAPRFVH